MLNMLNSMRRCVSSGELAQVEVTQVGHIGFPTLR